MQVDTQKDYSKALLEASPAFVAALNPEYQVINLSASFLKATGYSAGEVAGSDFPARFVPAEDRPALLARLEKLAASGQPAVFEHRVKARDGQTFLVEWQASAIFSEEGELDYYFAIGQDITERRRKEEALRLSETRFRTLFEQSLLSVQVFSPEGNLLHLNRACMELWDIPEDKIPWGYNILQDTQLAAIGLLPYIRAAFNGEATVIPASLYDPSQYSNVGVGRARWTRALIFPIKAPDGSVREVVITHEDITEQKLAEALLTEREAQYRSVFEATSDALLIVEIDSGEIIEVNPASCGLYGYSQEELVGRYVTEFVPPESILIHREITRKLKEGGQISGQALNKRKDGSTFHVDFLATRFIYKGKPHGLAVLRDITEQVQAYQLLEQRVAERTRELSFLLEVSRNLASTLQLKPLLKLTLSQLKEVVDYTGASLTLIEGEKAIVLESSLPELVSELKNTLRNFSSGPTLALWERISNREPVIIPDVRGDTPEAQLFRKFAGDKLDTLFDHIRSWVGIPLEYKGQVMGLMTMSHSQPDFYTAHHLELAQAIANHAAITIENVRLYEKAQAVAALEERQRLARELHDSVSQVLFGISLGTNSTRILLERDPDRVPQSLDYIHSLAQAGMAEMKALIFELRPESLEAEGLVVALAKQAAAIQARYGIQVQTHLDTEPDVPIAFKEALYRIGQESMHNTVKHAQASQIILSLVNSGDAVSLEIKDNGIGFDPDASYPGHLGLRSMRERVARLRGSLTIQGAPGQGATVRAWLPFSTGDGRSG